ncbi:hypothetical protein ABH926_001993 [Catenulispora sp. GP43]|uniref:sensor domain-containing protein n=1 Tax=Catenulispora sp. GP43 TaxID=3156263 RepID=UPI003511D68B
MAILAAAVLTTTACGGSGKAASSAASPGVPVASTGTTADTAPASSTATTAGTAAATASTSVLDATLTTDQISKLLLTGKDESGYTYDPSQDGKEITNTQDVVTTGGSACQTFVDAFEGLRSKYGTSAEVDRQLTNASTGQAIEDSVMAVGTADRALEMISDLTTGIKDCKSLTVTQSGLSVSMAPTAIPEMVRDGQVGYINYLNGGGKTSLMASEVVHVGTAVSVIAIIEPPTNDNAALQQLGTTLVHLSDVQVERLKNAQGL